MDVVRNLFNERFQEGGSCPHICFFDEFDYSELRCSIDGHEQVEFAFGGSHLSQIDVEEADWIGVELLLVKLVTFDLRQAADAMALQTTMKRRTSKRRDRGLQGVQAVVQRQ